MESQTEREKTERERKGGREGCREGGKEPEGGGESWEGKRRKGKKGEKNRE